MPYTESAARQKWCPFVRIDNSNRRYNTLSDGFENAEKMFHCIGTHCMAWRDLALSHMKGSVGEAAQERHGYCGLAGRPDLEQGW